MGKPGDSGGESSMSSSGLTSIYKLMMDFFVLYVGSHVYNFMIFKEVSETFNFNYHIVCLLSKHNNKTANHGKKLHLAPTLKPGLKTK